MKLYNCEEHGYQLNKCCSLTKEVGIVSVAFYDADKIEEVNGTEQF